MSGSCLWGCLGIILWFTHTFSSSEHPAVSCYCSVALCKSPVSPGKVLGCNIFNLRNKNFPKSKSSLGNLIMIFLLKEKGNFSFSFIRIINGFLAKLRIGRKASFKADVKQRPDNIRLRKKSHHQSCRMSNYLISATQYYSISARQY